MVWMGPFCHHFSDVKTCIQWWEGSLCLRLAWAPETASRGLGARDEHWLGFSCLQREQAASFLQVL